MPRAKQNEQLSKNRHNNLRKLVELTGGQNALARAVGTPSAYMSQVAGDVPKRDLGNAVASRIERALRLPPGWLDGAEPAVPETTMALIQDLRGAYRYAGAAAAELAVQRHAEISAAEGLNEAVRAWARQDEIAAREARVAAELAQGAHRHITAWLAGELVRLGWVLDILPTGVIEAAKGEKRVLFAPVTLSKESTVIGDRWRGALPALADHYIGVAASQNTVVFYVVPRHVAAASSRDGSELVVSARAGGATVGNTPCSELPTLDAI